MRTVIGDDRGAARLQPLEDLALRVGDRFVAGEEFAVGRGDGGDDRDMRTDDPGQAASSPAWFMPISNTPNAAVLGMRIRLSGTPV